MNGSPRPAPFEPASSVPPHLPVGGFVELEGEPCYRIAAFDQMGQFLISLPSDTDLWMFVASGGGLTAGRVDAAGSLFPYETVDRLHDARNHTGPITLFEVEAEGGLPVLWEPFTEAHDGDPAIERALYKNTTGNQLVFEEVHNELGLAFRYRWSASDEFGWIRTSTLENRANRAIEVRMLDGLRNILPYGAPLSLYQQASNLVDAYKKAEIDDASGLGVFSLTAQISDRTQPAEVLRANVVWTCGLEDARVHLSIDTVASFRHGKVIAREDELNGARGNYLVSSTLRASAGESVRWHIVGDTGLDHVGVVALRRRILEDQHLPESVGASIVRATRNLRRSVGSADGIQVSNHTEAASHHFANTLFNCMRGGVFPENYRIPRRGFTSFVESRNETVAARHANLLAGLPGEMELTELLRVARGSHDPNLVRLAFEYLPLSFSRRHGDPSRPWNQFSIRARNSDGTRAYGYEGNWRDIFQNWEALGLAFPGFLPGFVAKFLNASTIDGFNPYRLTDRGLEWEEPAPEDPWANIGYWGDHQIIYLLKLLEMLEDHFPGWVGDALDQAVYSYAEIPYRIRPYEALVEDPRVTIDYDKEQARRIAERVREKGADGKLIEDSRGKVLHVALLEKLLVPVLSKLSNLVPDAGIWMNTQRPEWNDANNALGGGGVSVVTLCYLRRHLEFLARLLDRPEPRSIQVSAEVVDWFNQLDLVFRAEEGILREKGIDDRRRKQFMDGVGGAFTSYRAAVYSHGLSDRTGILVSQVREFFLRALRFVEWGIRANRRKDGLFHTYNQLEFSEDHSRAAVVRLPEMLEGQVAALSSGMLDGQQSVALLDALFDSALFHEGHDTFLLYPEIELPGFLEKNVVRADRARAIPLLASLLDSGPNPLIQVDADGVARFQADLGSECELEAALDELAKDEELARLVQSDRRAVLELFEHTFGHECYTGRSGVMYGYEGLGCVYWHMVAKLLLATQESYSRAGRAGDDSRIVGRLGELYYRVRSGMGYEKSAAEFGAFPTDPYSHTPPDGGARQPGMTGQVKEEILTRLGELGVHAERGSLRFEPELLRQEEFLDAGTTFGFFGLDGAPRSMELPAGTLAFTVCQTPVVYVVSSSRWLEVVLEDGSRRRTAGRALDPALSREVFNRSGRIREIRVGVSA